MQWHLAPTGIPTCEKDVVVFQEVGQSYWSNLALCTSLQCILTFLGLPFHVHVNKFQVISHNGQLPPYRAWKDVVSVSPGERVRIRMAFRDYVGKTVYHCHVLDHEDRGMMGILDIQSA